MSSPLSPAISPSFLSYFFVFLSRFLDKTQHEVCCPLFFPLFVCFYFLKGLPFLSFPPFIFVSLSFSRFTPPQRHSVYGSLRTVFLQFNLGTFHCSFKTQRTPQKKTYTNTKHRKTHKHRERFEKKNLESV